MKGIISNIVIVMLVAANILVAALNYDAQKPRCMCDNCNKARVADSRYCHEHSEIMIERTICLEATTRN